MSAIIGEAFIEETKMIRELAKKIEPWIPKAQYIGSNENPEKLIPMYAKAIAERAFELAGNYKTDAYLYACVDRAAEEIFKKGGFLEYESDQAKRI